MPKHRPQSLDSEQSERALTGPKAAELKSGRARLLEQFSRTKTRLLGWLLFAAVVGLFLPAINNGFVNFDDQDYVTANPRVQHGLTWENIRWALGSVDAANWQPLTWMSHMADCLFFGVAPWGHHLTSVLLHAFNTLLVFWVLKKMTGAVWRSLMVAAFFGVHPLHVESVAWVSERKDVLSTLFFLLTLLTYTGWVQRIGTGKASAGFYYGLTLFLFVAGLMCKPMLVTLPFVLLLLDYWPLQRITLPLFHAPATVGRLWLEKLPFFAIAGAVCSVTLIAQERGGAFHAMAALPFMARLTNAVVSYFSYIGQFFHPVQLAIFYQHPGVWPVATVAVAGTGLLATTLAALLLRRQYPYVLVGWLWFGGTLVPVIGLVQVGMQATADRYTYIPSLGIFVMCVWGVHQLTRQWRYQEFGLGLVAVVCLLVCAVLTHRQIAYWANSETLFRHAVAVTDNNWVMENNLGQTIVADPKRTPEAMAHFEAALQVKPDYPEAHNNLANALAKIAGRSDEAISHYQAALRIEPNFAEAHNNLGNVLAGIPGRVDEAIGEYEHALRLKPDYAEAHFNLGRTLAKNPHQLPQALAQFEAAIRARPDYAEAHFNQANVLARLPGRLSEAVAEYGVTLQIKGDYAEAYFNLANTLALIPGRSDEAISNYLKALAINPDNAEAHNNVGAVLARLPNRQAEAIRHFEAALRINPNMVNARFNLGAALMGIPDQRQHAIEQFKAILEIMPHFAPARQMLDRLEANGA